MQYLTPSVSLFLDRSRPGTDGRCLIKLNVYFKPDKRRYATKFHASPAEWEKMYSPKLKEPALKQLRTALDALVSQASTIAESLTPFSFVAFEDALFNGARTSELKTNSLAQWFHAYIDELKRNDQVGTAISYNTTIVSLLTFRKNLLLQDITPDFLKAYERHMLAEGRSVSTIGIYLRQLRTIINQAIKAKVLSRDNYPFAHYTIPASRNIKKALKEDEIKRLLAYKAETEDHQKALDFWLLSYLCSGINFADIVSLRPENIQKNLLVYERVKTKRTRKKDIRPIKIGLNPTALAIIEKYRNADPANPFLFPILEHGLSATAIKYRTQNFLKWVNLRVKKIAEELQIDKNVTTYAARHSFSTILKRKGVSTEFIKESLGHSSVATTESYLDSFADEEKLSVVNLLTDL